jgi:large subunit ribosomal protein L7/L12
MAEEKELKEEAQNQEETQNQEEIQTEQVVEKEEEKTEEMTQEEKKEETEAPQKTDSGKFKDLIEKIESLTVVELAEFVSELEEKLGVSGMPMMAPAMAVGTPAQAGQSAETVEEKSLFNIFVKEAGDNKIGAIKVVREVRPDLGLKEAKDFVEGLPKILKENVKKEEAEEIKKKLEEAGLKVEIQ